MRCDFGALAAAVLLATAPVTAAPLAGNFGRPTVVDVNGFERFEQCYLDKVSAVIKAGR